MVILLKQLILLFSLFLTTQTYTDNCTFQWLNCTNNGTVKSCECLLQYRTCDINVECDMLDCQWCHGETLTQMIDLSIFLSVGLVIVLLLCGLAYFLNRKEYEVKKEVEQQQLIDVPI